MPEQEDLKISGTQLERVIRAAIATEETNILMARERIKAHRDGLSFVELMCHEAQRSDRKEEKHDRPDVKS